MKKVRWIEPRTKIKRWIALDIFGICILSFELGELTAHWLDLPVYGFLNTGVMLAGIIITVFASYKIIKSTLVVFENAEASKPKDSIDIDKLGHLIYEKRLLIRGPKIVVIGGGTGLSTMLRGLKQYTSNITAIVTVADDGGGSGVLRETLGILPPGDIRNCLLALADTEPVMEELMQYRFTEGMLKGQSFGNLFIAAMNGISDNFEEAIRKMSDVLAVTGKVLPVTLSDVRLHAELENGSFIEGESKISKREQYKDVPIKRVFIEPQDVSAIPEALSAIDEADAVILGPGSLYTSIIPNLLVKDIVRHIENSDAVKIYVANIMTQPGETTGYSVSDHIEAIQNYSRKKIIDYVIVNNGKIPGWLYGKYIEDGAAEVVVNKDRISSFGVNTVEDNFVYIYKNLVRHNSRKLAYRIMEIILNRKLSNDKKRLIEYYYLSERLKEIMG